MAVTGALFVGCGDSEAMTKEYYENNIEQAGKRVEACKKLEKFKGNEQLDCDNAQRALRSHKMSNSQNYSHDIDSSREEAKRILGEHF